MTLADWVSMTATEVRQHGIAGLREPAYQLRLGLLRRLDWVRDGVPIYERDWDALLVLDGCRFDLLTEVVDEYDYIESAAAVDSVASSSTQWMQRNFGSSFADEVGRTAYVTGNPRSAHSLPGRDRFAVLDEVWRYAWSDDHGTVLPDALTERAIAIGREHAPERLIVHYMQPHCPFVPDPIGDVPTAANELGESRERDTTVPWDRLRDGEVSRERVWEGYKANLRFVLDRLDRLLTNLDADRVVITADHGNLLGEYGVYAHPAHVAVDELRRVPWCEATATDTGTVDPDLTPDEDTVDADGLDDRLAALGYR